MAKKKGASPGNQNAKNKKPSTLVQFRVPHKLFDDIFNAAQKDEVKISAWIRDVCAAEIRRRERKKK